MTVDDQEMTDVDANQVTEREIVSLDGKLDLMTDLKAKLERQQESLDILLVSKRALAKHGERYRGMNVVEQTGRARAQQLTLRSAMQSSQDSLPQRVKHLRVSFAYTAIHTDEV